MKFTYNLINYEINSFTYKFLFLLFFSFILLSVSGCRSDDKLTNSIKISAGYIDNFSKPNGMFDYEVNMATGKVSDRNYNILRHSGTIYALANYYIEYKDSKSLKTLRQATHYLKTCCVKPVEDKKDILGIWSIKSINKSMPSSQLKLGGTGLGLVALLSMEKINPGTTDTDILRKLGNFILYLQKEDGSFYSKYIPSTVGRDDSWTSLYYPGEAALGLVMLYEYDPQPKWFDHALKALIYLSELRKNEKNVPPDHWALLATAKLIEISNERNISIPKELIIDHGKQVVNGIIKGIPAIKKTDRRYGCLTRDCRTTPSSTRLEGLIAFYNVLEPKDNELKETIARVSQNGIEFLIWAQIKEGKYKGAIPVGLLGDNNQLNNITGRQAIVRIDYVQHALSAFLDYQRVFRKI